MAKDTRTQYKKCPTEKKCLKYPHMELEAGKKQYLFLENGGQNFTQLFVGHPFFLALISTWTNFVGKLVHYITVLHNTDACKVPEFKQWTDPSNIAVKVYGWYQI